MTAALAHAHAYVFCLQLLPLGGENLDNQCRDCQENPLERKPPPTDKEPPEDAAVLGYQLCFSNCTFTLELPHLGQVMLFLLLSKRWLYCRTLQSQKQSAIPRISRLH